MSALRESLRCAPQPPAPRSPPVLFRLVTRHSPLLLSVGINGTMWVPRASAISDEEPAARRPCRACALRCLLRLQASASILGVLTTPEAYIRWINEHLGFNPRSQANSDALSDFVIADLKANCPTFRRALESGNLVPKKNPNVRTKVAERSIDLVFHEPSSAPALSVRLSVEHKTIMTAHDKARKNRYGDLIAYCNHMHNHRKDCIAAGIVVVNTSPEYENPDAFAKGLKRPRFNMEKVVTDTVGIFSMIPLRDEPDNPNDQPEALSVIVVKYDGLHPASLIKGPPAPGPKDAVHYGNFIRRICRLFEKRFSGR